MVWSHVLGSHPGFARALVIRMTRLGRHPRSICIGPYLLYKRECRAVQFRYWFHLFQVTRRGSGMLELLLRMPRSVGGCLGRRFWGRQRWPFASESQFCMPLPVLVFPTE